MNPLSPATYHRRHKRSTLLLLALIILATVGLFVMVAVLDSIPMRARFSYLTHVSRVYPAGSSSLEPAVVAQIRAHPDVARVIPDNGLPISPPTLIGLDTLRLMGVSQGGAQFLMDQYGVRLKEGRMLKPRTNEVVLSEEVVRALGLQIGDRIDRSIDERYYANVLSPLVLVGILEADPSAGSFQATLRTSSSAESAVSGGERHTPHVGFASYEYFEGHELYASGRASLLVAARDGRKSTVDRFLANTIRSPRTEVETFEEIARLVAMGRRGLHVLFGTVNCVVAIVVALVVGVVNRIAMTQRLPEFGLLHAVGYHRRWLIARLTFETGAVAAAGWIFGLALSWLILGWLQAGPYYSMGMELEMANLAPLWFVVPIPVVVVAFAAWSAARVFARFDAVAIIERGELAAEASGHRRAGKRSRVSRSSRRPLSSWTFYLRHRRRGLMLMASMALMILGVALPAFLISMLNDVLEASFEQLRYVSQVSPGGGYAVDPGVAAQIRSHPAVERVVPVMELSLGMLVPPGGSTGVSLYGAAEEELPALLDRFGMQLVEGRLPRARTSEIVISEAVALNRGLRVGDTVGGPVQQRDDENLLIADDIPAEMLIVGLLSPEELWLGFASLEYLQSHELTASRPVHLLVVPAVGRKPELDTWLESSVASTRTEVLTHGARHRDSRQTTQAMLLVFAAVESVIACVAAVAVATLNYIFLAQRQEEFGILHAVGRSRWWLVIRTVRESVSVVAAAWLMGAAACIAGLLYAQTNVYIPRGLSLDFTNLAPWLFTLPIPLTVVAVSSGLVVRMLRRLDPVSIVERRA